MIWYHDLVFEFLQGAQGPRGPVGAPGLKGDGYPGVAVSIDVSSFSYKSS